MSCPAWWDAIAFGVRFKPMRVLLFPLFRRLQRWHPPPIVFVCIFRLSLDVVVVVFRHSFVRRMILLLRHDVSWLPTFVSFVVVCLFLFRLFHCSFYTIMSIIGLRSLSSTAVSCGLITLKLPLRLGVAAVSSWL